MRTDKKPREFFNAMKKKPALQAILDNFEDYTEEQLENIAGQPLWIRTILVELKQEESLPPVDEEAHLATIEAIADRMVSTSPPSEPTKYDVFQYNGGDLLMPCGMTGSMTIEVNAGNHLYVIDCDHSIEKYVVGMDSTIGYLKKDQWFYFLNNSIFCGKMTKPEYSAYVSQNLGKNFVDRDEIAKAAGPNSYVSPEESDRGFRIIRHDVK